MKANTEIIATKVNPETQQFLRDVAEKQMVTVSWLIRWIIRNWIDEQKANGRKRAK